MENEVKKLKEIIKNQNQRIESLSRAVGQIEDWFASKGVLIGEYDMSGCGCDSKGVNR